MGRGSACAAVATAGGLWGTIALYSRPLAEMGFTELEIVFLRCAVSALAFGAFLSRRGLVGFKVKLGDAWLFVALGCGSFVTFNLFYLMTIRLSELAIASTLLYLAPSFVIMLSAVFGREFPRRRSVVACALAIAGASLVSGFGATAPSPLVVLCGVASAACYALYPLIGRRTVGRYAVSTTQFYSFLFAGVCLAPFVGRSAVSRALSVGAPAILPVLGIGLAATFVPYVIYNKALREVEASTASIVSFTEPMVAALLGAAVFREPLEVADVAGLAAMFAAVVMMNLPERRDGCRQARGRSILSRGCGKDTVQ